jgi:class 3 adenylate cyclase/pimeloyl-ACP methyl ester carboxylesterase
MSEGAQTQYVRTPRGHLAYQVTGAGDRTIFYLTGTFSHVEIRWQIPHLVRLNRRLMAFGRVVTVDPYGLGASDPLPYPNPTLDELAADLVSVLDAVGTEQVSIVASYHAVAPVLVMAAAFPERVDKLVLLGGYARLLAAPDFPEGVDTDALDAFLEAYLPVWGTGAAAAAVHGVVDPDEQERVAFARIEQATAAPGMMQRLLQWIWTSDVRDRVPNVRAPVLVFGIPTAIITAQVTKALVDQLADARFVDIGFDPVARGVGLDEMMAEIAEFLTGSRAVAHSDRRLAAILFTDLVGSTEHAATVGDERWRHLLDAFRLTVRREITRYGGREVNTRGDDFFAVFDRASSAIECSREVHRAVARMGLGTRSGIHVGEVDADGDDLTGVAVHVGARVAAHARPNEILVTSAAHEAVVGMAWTFADRGTHGLKGVPGDWRLFSVDW